MATEEMSLAEVTGNLSRLDEVLFRCLLMGDFQPEKPSRLMEDSHNGFAPIMEENPYSQLLNRAMRLGAALGNQYDEMSPEQTKEYNKCINQFNKEIKKFLPSLKLQNPIFQQELIKVKNQLHGMGKSDPSKMNLAYSLSTAKMKVWIGIINSQGLMLAEKWNPEIASCHEVIEHKGISWCVVFANAKRLTEAMELLKEINFRQVITDKPISEKITEDGTPYGVSQRLEDLVRKQHHLLEKIQENRDNIKDMGDFEGQHLGIDNIYSCRYLKIRFGLLPIEAIEQLKEHQDDPFVFSVISRENHYEWGVYFTTDEHIKEADDFFASIGFERIWMPQMSVERSQSRIAMWDDFIIDFQNEIDSLDEKRKNLVSEIRNHTNTLVTLEHVRGLDANFDDIFSCKYLRIRFGKLPIDAYSKLDYFEDHPFIFKAFDKDGQYYWGMYATTKEHMPEVEDMFDSLYFERVFIPEIAHGTPESAEKSISVLLEDAKIKLERVDAEISHCINNHRERFYDIYAMAKYLSDSFSIRKYVGKSGNEFRIIGFIPSQDSKDFIENMSVIENIKTDIMPPDSITKLTIPTKLKNNKFVKPFEMFVDMYGMPSYHDIDPTPILAITYTLLFGIMFGDLGQGIVIALLGWYIAKKSTDPSFGKILTRIGCSSTIFGFIYGSVFGLEHVLDPIFHMVGFAEKPIEVMDGDTINTLLISAIALGAILILVSMVTNIIIGVKQKNYERAIFGNNGLVGVVFYLAVLIGASINLLYGINLFNPVYVLLFIILPIIAIFLKHPLSQFMEGEKHIEFEGGIGSFIIEGFFELFEVLLSFVTNTMSFLRVGGFIISHAGMMSVVLTLAAMVSGGASVLVMIGGNIFVMCLEGFIVGIQCLRLEFYEMFSRYFNGDGEAFRPVIPGKKEQ